MPRYRKAALESSFVVNQSFELFALYQTNSLELCVGRVSKIFDQSKLDNNKRWERLQILSSISMFTEQCLMRFFYLQNYWFLFIEKLSADLWLLNIHFMQYVWWVCMRVVCVCVYVCLESYNAIICTWRV